MITKHEVEKIIVVRPATAVPTATNRLFHATNYTHNLAVGGFGAYVDTAGSGNPTATTGADWTSNYLGIPIRFIQRRDTSNDPAPLPERQFEQSQYIHNNCDLKMTIAGEAFSTPSISSWLIGDVSGNVGQIEVASNNPYKLQATSHGWRTDMVHSPYNLPTVIGSWTSLNWAIHPTATTTVRQRDYTVQALVRNFNIQASHGMNKTSFAIAISSAGGVGTTVAAAIAGGAGSTIVIGADQDCTNINMLVTDERLAALVALEASLIANYGILAGVATIVPYRLPEDCTTGVLAGTTATADMIFVMAIDEQLATYDEIPNTKRKIDVSLDQSIDGFAVDRRPISNPDEGAGQSRNLRLMYNNVEHYKQYSSSRTWGANHVAYPDEILDNEVYDIYNIAHCHSRTANSGTDATSSLLTTIALVHTNRTIGVSPFSTGIANPQKTYLEAILNALGNAYGVPGAIAL